MKFANLRMQLIGAIAMLAVSATTAVAHEFWIAPQQGRLEPGDQMVADLKVGLMLKGEAYPYLSNKFTSFTVAAAGILRPVTGNEGDIPALGKVAAKAGLQVITHQTVALRVTHDDWAIFQRYLKEEGLEAFEEEHRKRGLPQSGFAERYTRYAKALVQAGPVGPQDKDAPSGMLMELIADENPYADNIERLPVSLKWRGSPLANRQINVFHSAGGAVTRARIVTDGKGRAVIPLSGNGEYLLNAVHLESVDGDPVVWESHWASLSFKL